MIYLSDANLLTDHDLVNFSNSPNLCNFARRNSYPPCAMEDVCAPAGSRADTRVHGEIRKAPTERARHTGEEEGEGEETGGGARRPIEGPRVVGVGTTRRERNLDKLVLHAQRTSLCPADLLEQMRRDRPLLEGGVSLALFSSRPAEHSLRVPWLYRLGLLICAPLAILAIYDCNISLSSGQIPPFQHYRFTSMEQRNGSAPPEAPGIATFGLMRRGEMRDGLSRMGQQRACKAGDADGGLFRVDGASMTLSLGGRSERGYLGWYIRTLEEPGTQGQDAVRFVLEGSDDEETWTKVGSSASAAHMDRVVWTDGEAGVPEGRGRNLVLDSTMNPWHWASFSLCHVILLLGSLASLCLAAAGRADWSTWLLVRTLCLQSAIRFALGLILVLGGGADGSVGGGYSMCLGAAYAFGAAALPTELFDAGIVAFAGSQLVLEPVFAGLLFQGVPGPGAAPLRAAPGNAALLSLGLLSLAARLGIVLRVRRGIVAGSAAYLEAWKGVCSGQGGDVARLRRIVRAAARSCHGARARQLRQTAHEGAVTLSGARKATLDAAAMVKLQRGSVATTIDSSSGNEPPINKKGRSRGHSDKRSRSGLWRHSDTVSCVFGVIDPNHGSTGPIPYMTANVLQSSRFGQAIKRQPHERLAAEDLGRPVRKLDQIYSQAFLVHDIFLEYVVSLAAEHEGMFRLKAAGEGGRLFDAWDGGLDGVAKFQLGGMKPVSRAISKAELAYKGDASLLKDMVRETIFFERVEQLEACLASLVEDPMIDLVRVRSTMQPPGQFCPLEAGSPLWAGMPFVSVCLRMAGSQEAWGMCVDAHVCELLLALTGVACVETPDMRRAFREWRSCRRVMEALAWRPQKRSGRSSSVWPGKEGEEGAEEANGLHAKDIHSPGWLKDGQGLVRSNSGGCSRRLETGPAQKGVPTPRGGSTSFGLKVSEEMEELLDGLCRLSALGVADFLDRRWKSITSADNDHGFESSSLSGLFYARHPITATTSRWQVQAFVIALGSYLICIAALASMHLERQASGYSVGPWRHYRLEAALTRNGTAVGGVVGPGVSEFGVIGKTGCTPHGLLPPDLGQGSEPSPSWSGPVGASYLISYPLPVSIAGWYLRTGLGEGSEWADPSYFNVWATDGGFDLGDGSCARGGAGGGGERWWNAGEEQEWCGAVWRRVGSPHWRFNALAPTEYVNETRGSEFFDFLQVEVSLPKERGALQTWLLPPPWHLYLGYWVVSQLLSGGALILTGLSHRLRRWTRLVPAPHVCLPVGATAACLTVAISGVANAVEGAPTHAWEQLCVTFSTILICIAWLKQGPTIILALWGYVLSENGSWMALCYWFWGSPFERMSFLGAWSFCITLTVTAVRLRTVGQSKKLFLSDLAVYEEVWKKHSEDEDSRACIEHLERVVRMIGLDDKVSCRQHNRQRADRLALAQRQRYLKEQPNLNPHVFPLFWDIGHWLVPCRPDHRSLVTSVNQLYASAAIANLLLVERVKHWATVSSGMVRVLEVEPAEPAEGGGEEGGDRQDIVRDRFVSWSKVQADPAPKANATMMTAMKRHSRAIEKLLRSYGNRPSQLLDISRQALVFKAMKDLSMCLGVMAADENVRVERLKNRMSHSHDPYETGGYRDVLINLKVVNKEAQQLGVELHVCEVQLLLEDFANVKTAEGHKKYVLARNAMGN